ncbi:hypothetical protein NL480_30320, partial [Klebsiella pneumoniae]|nr:hypothetical protein [Klebsiella pneumoniae]
MNTVRMSMHQLLRTLTRAPIMLIMASVMAFTIAPHLAWIFVVAIPILLIAMLLLIKVGQPRFKKM